MSVATSNRAELGAARPAGSGSPTRLERPRVMRGEATRRWLKHARKPPLHRAYRAHSGPIGARRRLAPGARLARTRTGCAFCRRHRQNFAGKRTQAAGTGLAMVLDHESHSGATRPGPPRYRNTARWAGPSSGNVQPCAEVNLQRPRAAADDAYGARGAVSPAIGASQPRDRSGTNAPGA
jgi:hypothetical protein